MEEWRVVKSVGWWVGGDSFMSSEIWGMGFTGGGCFEDVGVGFVVGFGGFGGGE